MASFPREVELRRPNKCTKVVVTLTSAPVSELLEFGHLLPDVDLVVLEEDA